MKKSLSLVVISTYQRRQIQSSTQYYGHVVQANVVYGCNGAVLS